jgi:hypothetical protein
VKKIISILVLWVFLTGSGGYYFLFKIKQFANYCKIENEITNHDKDVLQQVIIFKRGEKTCLKWIKEQKEFIYQGKIYDIVRCIFSGKYVFYYCINDTKEKKLIADFENKNHANNRTNQITRRIIPFQFILYSPLITLYREPSAWHYYQALNHYLPPVNNTLSPPPKGIQNV